MIEQVTNGDNVLALIVRASFTCEGVRFFTPGDYSQQLGYMSHPAGKVIDPHVHNPVERSVTQTQEVLFVRAGKLRVEFDDDRRFLESCVLQTGDVILLASGGHGFEVLEDLEMIEVKQGPYTGEQDKTRFDADSIEASESGVS